MKKFLSSLICTMFLMSSFGLATEATTFAKATSKTVKSQTKAVGAKTKKTKKSKKSTKKLIKKSTVTTKTTVHKDGDKTITNTTTTKTSK